MDGKSTLLPTSQLAHSESFIAIILSNQTLQKPVKFMSTPQKNNIEDHLQFLVGERNPFTEPDHLEKTRFYIAKQFEAFGYSVTEEAVDFEGTRSFNIMGKGNNSADKSFVLAAHYDTKPGTPGADDNASAVAALLEIARCLADQTFHTPIIFTAFTLEEYGFIGSRHFIKKAIERNESFTGMISLEMLGYKNLAPHSQTYPPYVDAEKYPDSGDFIAVVGNEPSAQLAQNLAAGMKQFVPSLKVETLVVPGTGENFNEVRLSDHSPFWDAGIPAVMVTDTAFFRNPH
ncbi:MAG: M20/M25/M40 family metallo-hydrolase, partial [Nitrospinae bacterium]|nr:M20/M25/M40 family metallo-hydrolase [Nitrospinota bacterium]